MFGVIVIYEILWQEVGICLEPLIATCHAWSRVSMRCRVKAVKVVRIFAKPSQHCLECPLSQVNGALRQNSGAVSAQTADDMWRGDATISERIERKEKV